jgi:urease accessory protein
MISRQGIHGTISVALAIIASPAIAHSNHDSLTTGAGLAHPLTGIDHLVAMVAIGFLAAKQDNMPVWSLPATFVLMMAIGMTSGDFGLATISPEWAVTGCLMLSGLALLMKRDLTPWFAVALAAVSGLAHGLAHASDSAAIALPPQYVLGAVGMTAILHCAGTIGGLAIVRLPMQWQRRGWQGIGLMTAATGVAVISL